MKDAVLQLAGLACTSQEQPGAYTRRLEAACQLLHEGLRLPQATGAQPSSSGHPAHNGATSAQTAFGGPASHNVPPAAPSPIPSATGSIAAGELCTLLLTDQEVLDVVLGLHDVRSAQLCRLMPWSDPHPLKLPPPSEALAKQLSQSQRSVPGSQLLAFVSALDDDNSREGDPLLRVWDSMHRAMLLVLAALQSLPIRPHPQHPDPAATTLAHTTTSQLPPGYHRCSACLLLSLRLAIFLTQHCVEQPLNKDPALARLHTTLPRLLLGLSTAMSVMQAAGHPEAQAQCVQFVRCLLLLGLKLAINLAITIPTASSNSSRHHNSSRGQASSRGPRGDTGRSGAARSAGDKLHAQDVVSYGYLTQALWDVFGRQEEGFASKVFNTSSQEGTDSVKELIKDVTSFVAMATMVTHQHSICLKQMMKDAARAAGRTSARVAASRHSAAAASMPQQVSHILRLLARFLPDFQAAIVAVELSAAVVTIDSKVTGEKMLECFFTSLSTMYTALHQAVVELTVLMPDWRRRPAMLRAGLRVATAGALASSTMVALQHIVPHTDSKPSLLPASVQRLPEMEEQVISNMSSHVTHLWSLVLVQVGLHEPPTGPFQSDDDFIHCTLTDRVAVLPSPSLPQLAPLALDLVLGMENTLQMVMRQQDMVWKWPFWNDGNLVQSLADGYRILLALFGHAIEVLATPSVVGPAGLAAQPASWLPCGNSLVEGWCTRLLAGVCKMMCIATPASTAVPLLLKIMLNRGLQGSYRLLLRGQPVAPPSMSPEAERLLSCLTLVLTAMVPQDLCLALAGGVTNTVPGLEMTVKEERRTMGVALSKLQPEQVWTWQALAAGTPAEATLQGLLPALASLFQVQGLVTPRAPGWRHQRLTLAMGEWHKC